MKMSRFSAVILVLSLLVSLSILPSTAGAATTFTVSTTADNTTSDGSCTLREAILQFNGTAANSDCGTLSGEPYSINFAVSGTVTLASTLNIYHSMTIDGTGQDITVSGNNSVMVFYMTQGVTFTVKNLTVANGQAFIASGIYNDGGTLNMEDCTVTGNSATYDGGGIYVQYGAATISNSTISGNSAAEGFGGGIMNFGGTVTMTGSTITGNSAGNQGGGITTGDSTGHLSVTNCSIADNTAVNGGGGINSVGTTTITNSVITGNSSAYYGSGISSGGGTLAVTGSTIANNSAKAGGGIYVFFDSAIVTDSTVSGNSATQGGGGISANSPATLTVKNSTISGNSTGSAGNGGGIMSYGTVALTNCTIAGNSGAYGGAIYEGAGTITIRNCTISGNSATNGGAISRESSATLTVTNSIITKGSSGTNCYYAFSTGSSSNLADDDSCGSSIADSSAILLGPLANYGGSTQTMPLLPGSVAIDAGDSAACADAATVNSLDQRGIARPLGHCDIGAFESLGFALNKSGGDNQSSFINSVFAVPLAVTVTANSAAEPVSGGRVTFTPPASGATASISDNPATIAGDGKVSVTAKANGTSGGPYIIAVGAAGATGVTFSLTNVYKEVTLTIGFAGDGSGTVTSISPTEPAINCIKGSPGGCSATFPFNTPVTLAAASDWKSVFGSWRGGAAGGDSQLAVTMDGDMAVTATFNPDNRVRLLPGGTLYASIQESYDSVPSGTMTIQAQVKAFLEDLLFNNSTSVTLLGGMNDSYNQTMGYTSVNRLTVRNGQAVISNIIIE